MVPQHLVATTAINAQTQAGIDGRVAIQSHQRSSVHECERRWRLKVSPILSRVMFLESASIRSTFLIEVPQAIAVIIWCAEMNHLASIHITPQPQTRTTHTQRCIVERHQIRCSRLASI